MMEIVIGSYRRGVLEDTFCRALKADNIRVSVVYVVFVDFAYNITIQALGKEATFTMTTMFLEDATYQQIRHALLNVLR